MNVEVKEKILKFDIDQKIISIFHWKVSPTGAEIKWLVDEWWFIYILADVFIILIIIFNEIDLAQFIQLNKSKMK